LVSFAKQPVFIFQKISRIALNDSSAINLSASIQKKMQKKYKKNLPMDQRNALSTKIAELPELIPQLLITSASSQPSQEFTQSKFGSVQRLQAHLQCLLAFALRGVNSCKNQPLGLMLVQIQPEPFFTILAVAAEIDFI
jgi:hypothetical protein